MQETTDTLDTLSTANGNTGNMLFLVLFALTAFAVLFWYLLRNSKGKEFKSKANIAARSERKLVSKLSSPESKPKPPISQPKTEPPTPKPISEPSRPESKPVPPNFQPKPEPTKPKPKPEPIPEPSKSETILEPSKPKYIGYNPINIFEQTEPLKFPYVIMPKPGCVIKFPQKGKSRRKGYKEEEFKKYLAKYFKTSFQLFDDRYILIKDGRIPYEPDFALIDEKDNKNIFLNVEIDEPYEGSNDISTRKTTHFSFADTNRNNAFKNRGWIVIRFAEIQVHQSPDSCCLFIANVISNIHSTYKIPDALSSVKTIASTPQWTKEEGDKMSKVKYRESYLGIESFGIVAENMPNYADETKLGEDVEKQVKDEPAIKIPVTISTIENSTLDLIKMAIQNKHFIAFKYNGSQTIVKPLSLNTGTLNAYCYVKNTTKTFPIESIVNPNIKQKAFTLEATGTNIGLDRIKSIVNTAIQYHKFVRMRYTRSAWTSMELDEETGEILANVITAEESTRTISNVQLSINALNQQHIQQYNLNENHVTAYCHRREEQRTFRFDRIAELAILDLN